MAHHKQALKRHRQSLERRDHNRFFRKTMRSSIKAVEAPEEKLDPQQLKQRLQDAVSFIAHVAAKGIIPKQRAARKIARMMRRFKPQP